MKKVLNSLLRYILPLLLGGAIMYWTYRDFNFSQVSDVFLHEMDFWWMLLSLLFGILSQIVRGVRWKQTLEPLNEYPRVNNCIDAIFISYAANLVLPRIGEISRCGVLAKTDNVSFVKSLGTVVTERVIDTICIGLMTLAVLVFEWNIFETFFQETGTKLEIVKKIFTSTDFYWAILLLLLFSWGIWILFKRLSLIKRVKQLCLNMWDGIKSVREVRKPWLFIWYTILIWLCYLLHFYLTFFCFEFTNHLSFMAGLVMFVVGSIAVVIPTPNGAGPWHYAVITMMVLYGVSPNDAGMFALLVHAIQTLLIIVLGVYALLTIQIRNKRIINQGTSKKRCS